MRAVPQSCIQNHNNGTGQLANAIISYTGGEIGIPDALPRSEMAPIVDGCFDEILDRAVPIPPKPLDRASFNPQHVPLASPSKVTSVNQGRVFSWVLGDSAVNANWEDPILNRINSPDGNLTAEDNVIEVDGSSPVAFWFIQNNFYEPHP